MKIILYHNLSFLYDSDILPQTQLKFLPEVYVYPFWPSIKSRKYWCSYTYSCIRYMNLLACLRIISFPNVFQFSICCTHTIRQCWCHGARAYQGVLTLTFKNSNFYFFRPLTKILSEEVIKVNWLCEQMHSSLWFKYE